MRTQLQPALALVLVQLCVVTFATEQQQFNHINEQPLAPFERVRPIVRSDGTTNTREPVDTLFREGPPESEIGFASLEDELRDKFPRPVASVSRDVGNLHPEEVYYADDDMLIIKGGGYGSQSFQQPSQDIQTPDETVREFVPHDRRPPNPHEEYHGNIATIVKAPSVTRAPSPLQALPTSQYPVTLLGVLTRKPQWVYTYSPFAVRLRYYLPLAYWYRAQPYRPPSLLHDTRVNFVQPRPHINPDAEVIQTHSKPSNHNRHRETLIQKSHRTPSQPLL